MSHNKQDIVRHPPVAPPPKPQKDHNQQKHWSQRIQETVVSALPEGEFGIHLKGGADNGQFCYISELKLSQLTFHNGKLYVDDIILEIQGQKIAGYTLRDATIWLKQVGQNGAPIMVKTVKIGLLPRDLKQYLAARFQKGSVDHDLQQTIRDNLYLRTVPCTTRKPRPKEKNGVDYTFLSMEEFLHLEKDGKLLESGVYGGNHYGTPKPPHEPKGPLLRRTGSVGQVADKRKRTRSIGDPGSAKSSPVPFHEEISRKKSLERAHSSTDLGPLPPNWEMAYTDDGHPYFIDHDTEATHWLDPRLSHLQKQTAMDCNDDELPFGWEKVEDPHYGTYYIDHVNRRTQYENPVAQAKRTQGNDLNSTLPRTKKSQDSAKRSTSDSNMMNHHRGAPPDYSQHGKALRGRKDPKRVFTKIPDELRGEIVNTSLTKSIRGFGFTIIGGDHSDEEFLQIKKVVENGPAYLDGVLTTGDVLVYVDDKCVLGYSHQDIVNLFQTIEPLQRVSLSVCRGYSLPFDPDDPNTEIIVTVAVSLPSGDSPFVLAPPSYAFHQENHPNSGMNFTSANNPKSLPDLTRSVKSNSDNSLQGSGGGGSLRNDNAPDVLDSSSSKVETLTMYIVRGEMGFGFTIADSAFGQRVKQILDKPRCKDLQESDILQEINSVNVKNMSHSQIVQVLKECPKGVETKIVIQRGGVPLRSRKPSNQGTKTEGNTSDTSFTSNPGAFFFNEDKQTSGHNRFMNGGIDNNKENHDMIDGSKPAIPSRPKTPNQSDSRPKTPIDRPKTPTRTLIEDHGKPPLGNRHMEMFSTHNDLRRDNDEIRDLGSQGQDLNQSRSSSEFYDINTRPPPGPRHDQYRNEQRTFRPDTFSRSNSAAQFNSHDREREVTKPGMFRSRTPGPDMLHRGHGPDYRGDHQRPKTPTAQDMRSKTPLPGSSYNYSDRGGYQNNTFGMNGPSRQGFGQQRQWGFNNYPGSPPTVRRGGDDYQDPYKNNFSTFSQKGAGHPSRQSTSFEDVNPAPSNLTRVPKRLPLQSNSSFNSQYSSSPRLPPRMSNREEAVRVAEYSVTLSRQDSGFGFRIIGGTEEGSQVSVGHIVPGGAADLDTRIRTGDEITHVDGISVLNSTHQRVVLLMTNAGTTGRVTLGLRRRILVSGETSYNGMSEVYDITVNRRETEGFGFVIISSVTKSGSVIGEFIGRILENSPAERCGRLHVGDRILAVNGVDISCMHHEEIVNLIKEAGYSVTLTIGIPQDDASSTTSNSQKGSQGSMVNAMAYPTSNDTDMRRYPPPPLPGDRMKEINRQRSMSNHQHSDEEEYLVVELQRGSRGFGFSIRGGTEFNSMPLFVLRIAEDGPADMDGRLRVGDQILEMNGFRTDNMSHSDAIDVIQYGGTNVSLLILRTGKLPPNFENNIQLPWLVDDREFQHMLSNGEFLSYENCVSLCGPSKAGKSTLASLLIGEDIPLTWNSTDGLVIYFGRNGIDMKEKKMVPLKGGEKGHPVFSKILRGNPGIHKNYSVDLSSKKQRTSFALSTGGIMSTKESTTKESQRCFDSGEHLNEVGSRDLDSGIYSIKSSEGHPRTQSLSYGIEELLKDDNDTLKLQADILEEVKNGQYRIDVAPSDLVDFGGQKSYDMTHQLFIQHGGSFVLLFDARFGLHNNLQEYPQGDINAASILKHWVDSILTYTEDSGDIMPMIVFAATHRDMCNQNKITKLKEDFTLEIRQMFSGHEKKNHIFLDTVYFISSINTQDSEIQSMTNQLVSFAMKQSSWGQRRPMAWVPLEIQIARLKTQGVTIITKTQLEQLNSLNEEHALTETGLKYFLLIQHSLGKLKYYNLPGLDQFIVIYPPALVSILASFITDEIFWPKKLDLRMVLQTLTETGKISKKDLFKIWEQDHFQHFFRDDETKEFVITLLIHLDILIIPKGFKQKSMSEIYLVPCTVKASPPPNFFDSRAQKEHTISLAYSLSLHSIPSALAYKAVSSVASVWPLQEISGKLCLYHKAAFFHADENDLRIYLDDNRIMVHLTNRSSNLLSISPDVAASIQECLTMNLNSSLLSYYNMCGRKHNKMGDLFKIEVGLPCKDTVCFQTMFEANKVSDWVCLNGKKHKTKYLRYWSFDRKQEECPTDCLGLDAVELQAVPSNKHLIRLSSQFRIQSFKAYILNLGLKEKDYENISQQYETNGPESVMFMALIKWRDTQLYHCTLQQLHDALVEVEIDCHRICQISRKDTALLDIAEGSLLCSPKDDVLLNLSHNVGNCTIQLGIELGLEIDAILETMYRYPRDMHQQNLDILKKWKETCTKPTVLSLMQALKCVQSGGLQFMMKKYHIAS